MRGVIIAVIMLACSSLIFAAEDASITASSRGRLTIIEGHINNRETGQPVPYAPVKIHCIHEGKHNIISKSTLKTDGWGYFESQTFNILPSRTCKKGDEAWVEVTYGGQDWESEHLHVAKVDYDYHYANINGFVGVPEFSTVTLGLAVIAGCLGLVFIRKR